MSFYSYCWKTLFTVIPSLSLYIFRKQQKLFPKVLTLIARKVDLQAQSSIYAFLEDIQLLFLLLEELIYKPIHLFVIHSWGNNKSCFSAFLLLLLEKSLYRHSLIKQI